MNFKEYQEAVATMPLYDDPILGLVGEVGEVVEHIKKDRRPQDRRKILEVGEFQAELGDVLWYLTRLAYENGLSLEDIAAQNIIKLNKRHSQ